MKKRILILMMLLTAIVTGAWAQFTANSYFLTGTIAEWWLNSNYELTKDETYCTYSNDYCHCAGSQSAS
jgi:hypothetical protein